MDPNPFKHPAVILAKMRTAIEPSLLGAGFQFDGRNNPSIPIYLYLDYSRPGELFRLSWDRRDSNHFIGFTAELMDEPQGCKTIARTDLSGMSKIPKIRTNVEIRIRIDSFVAAVKAFLDSLPRPVAPNET